jgi:hypothetical protein
LAQRLRKLFRRSQRRFGAALSIGPLNHRTRLRQGLPRVERRGGAQYRRVGVAASESFLAWQPRRPDGDARGKRAAAKTPVSAHALHSVLLSREYDVSIELYRSDYAV